MRWGPFVLAGLIVSNTLWSAQLATGTTLDQSNLVTPTGTLVENDFDQYHCGTPDIPPAHKGYDLFGNPTAGVDPIYAAFAGTVVKVENTGGIGYGKHVIIRHQTSGTTKYETLYGHLNDWGANIVVGYNVLRGDLIGHKGATGNAFGVHLHFELRRKTNDQSSTVTSQADSQSVDSTLGCNPTQRSINALVEFDIPWDDLYVALKWFLRNFNSSGSANITFTFGRTSDLALSADFDGDGEDDAILFRKPNSWFVDLNLDGLSEFSFTYGTAAGTDTPVVGDWDGDSVATPGVYRGNLWLLDDNYDGFPDHTAAFGASAGTDIPVPGDWDGNGTFTPGVFRKPNGWYYSNDFTGTTHGSFTYGAGGGGDLPLVGDWDGCSPPLACSTAQGVARASTRLLSYTLGGTTDLSFGYGRTLDTAGAGDWDGNSTSTPSVARGTT